jgi:hypothetical protein
MAHDKKRTKLFFSGIILSIFILVAIAGADPDSTIGTLTIHSDPQGASVYIDGTLLGTTPFTSSSIPAGDHQITLTMTGYENYITTTTVPGGGSAEGTYTMVPEVVITGTPEKPVSGDLTINSVPQGASVTIDGISQGMTPLALHGIPAGDHSVLLSLAGYADFPSTITVPPGGVFNDIYTLSCNVLTVDSTPQGAYVSVDGVSHGTTPVSIREVTAGNHALILTHIGYEDFTTTVNIQPGSELKAFYPLESAGTTTTTTSPPLTVTSILTTPVVTITTSHATVTPPPASANCTHYYNKTASLDRSPDGKINCTVIIRTDDNLAILSVPGGTLATDTENKPLEQISISSLSASEIPVYAGSDPIKSTGRAYRYLPEHAVFDQPVTVTFVLSESEQRSFDPSDLIIRETSKDGQAWEDLPTTYDPVTRAVTVQVSHFSIIGLFSRNMPVDAPIIAPSMKDTIRSVVAPRNMSLPLSSVVPDSVAPVAGITLGVSLTLAGTLASGSAFFSRLYQMLIKLLQGFVKSESVMLMSATEVAKRKISPAKNLSQIFLGISSREFCVIGITAIGFAVAFVLQAHLSLNILTVIIFVCTGGIAAILHDLGHKYWANRVGCATEYKFWGLGTVTMFSTAWLFGNAFAKPSRTVIQSDKKPTLEENALIKFAGPLVSMAVGVLSLFMIPLGGVFAIAGAAGFSMNLLGSVYALVPIKPNDGVEIFAWNKFIWAIVFFPLLGFYLYLYL